MIDQRRGMVFNATFHNISEIIGGRNRSVRKKPPTCRKSLTNFTTQCYIEYTSPERDSNSQLQCCYILQALVAQVIVNPTTIRSVPRRSRWTNEVHDSGSVYAVIISYRTFYLFTTFVVHLVTRRVLHFKQELPTIPENMSSHL